MGSQRLAFASDTDANAGGGGGSTATGGTWTEVKQGYRVTITRADGSKVAEPVDILFSSKPKEVENYHNYKKETALSSRKIDAVTASEIGFSSLPRPVVASGNSLVGNGEYLREYLLSKGAADTSNLTKLVNAKHKGQYIFPISEGKKEPAVIIVERKYKIFVEPVFWFTPIQVETLPNGSIVRRPYDSEVYGTITNHAQWSKQSEANKKFNDNKMYTNSNLTYVAAQALKLIKSDSQAGLSAPAGITRATLRDKLLSNNGYGVQIYSPTDLEGEPDKPQPPAPPLPAPTTKYMYTYTNTEVMLSTNLTADKEPIYPSKINGNDLTKGKYSTATSVTFKSNAGDTVASNKVEALPLNAKTPVFAKWTTPATPTTLEWTISGNTSGALEHDKIIMVIVELTEKTPPDTKSTDKRPTEISKVSPKRPPNKIAMTELSEEFPKETLREDKLHTWNTYTAKIVPEGTAGHKWEIVNTIKHEVSPRFYVNLYPDKYCYTATSTTTKKTVTLKDKEKQKEIYKTQENFIMKSGYGVNIAAVYSTSSQYITSTPAILAYFPEFGYASDTPASKNRLGGYNRILEYYGNPRQDSLARMYEFKNNPYSVYSKNKNEHRPVHFTPIWYPDYAYEVNVLFSQLWTPVGELVAFESDKVNIEGSYFDDWVNVPSVEHPFGEGDGIPVTS